MSEIDYEKLASALLRTKAVSSTATATYPHGPGGLFSYPGLSQPVFSALALPMMGLQSRLPVEGTNETNPLFELITGVTASTGSEPEGPCDLPPTAGDTKLCITSVVFGRFSRASKVIDLDKTGLIVNRGEMTDLRLVNNPFVNQSANMPSLPGGMNPADVVKTTMGNQIFNLGVAWSRDFADILYNGNPTNNTAGGGYAEFRGLDSLINTGYQDAVTGNACAAADSLIYSYGNQIVNSTGSTAFNTITGIYFNLKHTARITGMMPVKWVIVMRPALFQEIANIWACSYMSARCTTNAIGNNSTQFVEARAVVELRDAMLNHMAETGQYLLIDGERVEVVLDDAIPETNIGGGTFSSSIYFVPLTVLGGTRATFLQYKDYDMTGAAETGNLWTGRAGHFQTSDNGRFLWHFLPPTMYCIQMAAKTEPRLVLRTPYLAARITNVRYTPFQPMRSWDPNAGASMYFDGGRTNYAGYPPASPSFFPPTS